MVRLLDARTGSYTEIRPFRQGIVRLCAHVAENRSDVDAGTVRVLLTADVLARVVDVHILRLGALADSRDGLLLHVAAAHVADDHGTEASVQDLTALDDPLALRLALLSVPLGRQADLTKAALIDAARTLTSLRRSVAEWAESRSAPVPAHVAASMRAAFDDLDTAAVVALLGSLATDATMPAGAGFEAVAYADRVLGLELTREIGRPRR